MIGIIFAAGIGTRLKPFTDSHPKALAPLGGEPALVRVLDKLFAAGARRVIVNIHHFPEQIVECCKGHPLADRIEFSDESSKLLDTAGALVKIARENNTLRTAPQDEPVVVHNADIYTDFNLDDMLADHASKGADATILVDPERASTRHFLFCGDMRLRGWENTQTGVKRPQDLATSALVPAAFGGVHVLTPALMQLISSTAPAELTPLSITDWYIDNCTRVAIHGFTPAYAYRWHDIGTPEKLAAAQECFS